MISGERTGLDRGKLRVDATLGKGRPAVSFEYFPPRNAEAAAQLYETIEQLQSLRPSYVSVTYGAGGSTRRDTVEVVHRIQSTLDTRAMAHLTCVGHSRGEIASIVDELWAKGVRNTLALRGDPPATAGAAALPPSEFASAADLVAFVRRRHDFCIAVAGYPEGHPRCRDLTEDVKNLKHKVDQGASFIITQLFFDNDHFYRFRDAARRAGVKVPIIAGIMPILNVAQIKRFVSMCGATIPTALLQRIESMQHDPQSVLAIGVDHALSQCRDLLSYGVDGLHFFTLNRSKATTMICLELEDQWELGEPETNWGAD